eukprot:CAMPEP_0174896954 /NCGR_PEP_ID=MMETSP0167-20121228/11012_1 /TAXON_ID=38298 /ORGANISM="Rhodella maculata, Strain CCMP736" /LENGTH=158 /DNA_ID=CAMNT_0016136649 /DNA_START=119 /DNA_END=595 /DNA_ORIENTATION=-
MSDNDDFGVRGGAPSDDVELPRATVKKFSTDVATASDARLTVESRELLFNCCTEFVALLSSESNEVCEREKKKTIMPEHVLAALKELGLDRFHEAVKEDFESGKEAAAAGDKSGKYGQKKRAGWSKMSNSSGMTTEELERIQRELFEKAKTDPADTNQ